jgi:fido (protein-threonine AMPylation protein)
MQPSNCPAWVYEDHPQRTLVRERVSGILVELAAGSLNTLAVAIDTREVHGQIFHELTPPDCEYYAGHYRGERFRYRGERFRCLRYYEVAIRSDPRVGKPPGSVAFLMAEIESQIRAGMLALDANTALPTKERLRYILALACRAFVYFLEIHPFANGNGHAGRMIVWSILLRYGHFPRHWPVEPRPPDPPYSELIVRHRNGDVEPLEKHILQTLVA